MFCSSGAGAGAVSTAVLGQGRCVLQFWGRGGEYCSSGAGAGAVTSGAGAVTSGAGAVTLGQGR